jgi:hypothetical protein
VSILDTNEAGHRIVTPEELAAERYCGEHGDNVDRSDHRKMIERFCGSPAEADVKAPRKPGRPRKATA